MVASILTAGYFIGKEYNDLIPDKVCVLEGEENNLDIDLPLGAVIEQADIKATNARSVNNYFLECKLFGVFELKTIQVGVIKSERIMPCGFQAGMYLDSKGVLVVDIAEVQSSDGLTYEPCLGKLQEGDYITNINGIPVTDKEQLQFLVGSYGEEALQIDVIRNEKSTKINTSE